jgi:short-subunit dehydrogenase involved in D-alanine esterification of teichoic acids
VNESILSIKSKFSKLDVVVNSAGVFKRTPVLCDNPEDVLAEAKNIIDVSFRFASNNKSQSF